MTRFYGSITPPVVDHMTLREINEYVTYMDEFVTNHPEGV